jgi:uncharacterized protein
MKIKVSDKVGSVSAEISSPEKPRAVLVLAHGAGAGMLHQFMKSLSDELGKQAIATLRFNFPFIELKKGRPDLPAVAQAAIAAAIEAGGKKFPGIPLYAGGKSFGGRMTSQLMAIKNIPAVKGVVFFGFPLHQPGNPGVERADHLKEVKVPMLFLQGTRDALADFKLIQQVVKKLKNSTLVSFEGADHSFKSGKQNLIPALAESFVNWIG